MADESEVNIRDLAVTVVEAIDGADRARAKGLAELLDLHVARAEGLLQERELRRTLNEDDPRLQALDRRLALYDAAGRSLYLEAVRASTEPPAPDRNAWKVYGRVVAPNGDPIPTPARLRGARVLLVDSMDRPLAGVGPVRLDESGAFLIEVALKRETPAGKAAAAAPPRVRLRVVNRADDEIARDDEALTPAAGTVAYREIILSSPRSADDETEEPPAGGPARRARRQAQTKARRRRSTAEAE